MNNEEPKRLEEYLDSLPIAFLPLIKTYKAKPVYYTIEDTKIKILQEKQILSDSSLRVKTTHILREIVFPNMDVFKFKEISSDKIKNYNGYPSLDIGFSPDFKEFSNNLKTFLIFFFIKFNNHHSTYTIKDNKISITCDSKKNRSFGDIYKICKNFSKDVTVIQLRETLAELINEGYISSFSCGDIHRRVFFVSYVKGDGNYFNTQYDEFGFDWRTLVTKAHNKDTYQGNDDNLHKIIF